MFVSYVIVTYNITSVISALGCSKRGTGSQSVCADSGFGYKRPHISSWHLLNAMEDKKEHFVCSPASSCAASKLFFSSLKRAWEQEWCSTWKGEIYHDIHLILKDMHSVYTHELLYDWEAVKYKYALPIKFKLILYICIYLHIYTFFFFKNWKILSESFILLCLFSLRNELEGMDDKLTCPCFAYFCFAYGTTCLCRSRNSLIGVSYFPWFRCLRAYGSAPEIKKIRIISSGYFRIKIFINFVLVLSSSPLPLSPPKFASLQRS